MGGPALAREVGTQTLQREDGIRTRGDGHPQSRGEAAGHAWVSAGRLQSLWQPGPEGGAPGLRDCHGSPSCDWEATPHPDTCRTQAGARRGLDLGAGDVVSAAPAARPSPGPAGSPGPDAPRQRWR